jgi:glycosyltransferase involved in cell wall biosynthesis
MSFSDFLCLDARYSTTRMVSKEHPLIKNEPASKLQTKLFLPANPERLGQGGLRTRGYFKHSPVDKPLVSIITVVLNGQCHLEQTIKSVIDQTYENVEYIIIDGGSTDRTLDVIRKYEGAIDYWVSEPDEGIYDAMNKGIGTASGEWIWMLNSDDSLINGAIRTVFSEKTVNFPDSVAVYGCLTKSFEGFNLIIGDRGLCYGEKTIRFNHPATVMHRSLFKEYGNFDTAYKYSSDYDFFTRLVGNGVKFDFVDEVLVNMRPEGSSDRVSNYFKRAKEHFAIDKKYFPYPAVIKNLILFFTVDLIKFVIRKILIKQRFPYLLRFYFSRKKGYVIR